LALFKEWFTFDQAKAGESTTAVTVVLRASNEWIQIDNGITIGLST